MSPKTAFENARDEADENIADDARREIQRQFRLKRKRRRSVRAFRFVVVFM